MQAHGFVLEFRPPRPREHAVVVERRGEAAVAVGAYYRLFARPFAETPEAAREDQPIVRPELVLAYKGRIDNRTEIARRLAKPELATAADGTVMAEAYLAWGRTFPARVLGEYCFALVDTRDGSIVAGRDTVGYVRLVKYESGGRIWVATDTDLLLAALPTVPPLDDETQLEFIATGGQVRSGRTVYTGVCEIAPAHTFAHDGQRSDEAPYWHPDPHRRIVLADDREYADAFNLLLFEAVTAALRTNTPVWCELSGGLDSSTVTAVAARVQGAGLGSAHELGAFSVVFSQLKTADESELQSAVLERYPLPHYTLDRDAYLQDYANLNLRHPYEPDPHVFDGPYVIATRQLHEAHGVGVALTGVGGDQVFCGDGFPPDHLSELLRRRQVKSWLAEVKHWLSNERYSLWRLIWDHSRNVLPTSGGAAWARTLDDPAALGIGWLTPDSQRRVAKLGTLHARRLFDDAARESHYRRIRGIGSLTASARRPWTRRLPLLYRPLVEFMLAIPWEQKIRPDQDRVIQRRAMKEILPDVVRVRPDKRGPTGTILRALAKDWPNAARFAAGTHLVERGFVERAVFQREIERMRHGVIGNRLPFLMAALALEAWLGLPPALRRLDDRTFHELWQSRGA